MKKGKSPKSREIPEKALLGISRSLLSLSDLKKIKIKKRHEIVREPYSYVYIRNLFNYERWVVVRNGRRTNYVNIYGSANGEVSII